MKFRTHCDSSNSLIIELEYLNQTQKSSELGLRQRLCPRNCATRRCVWSVPHRPRSSKELPPSRQVEHSVPLFQTSVFQGLTKANSGYSNDSTLIQKTSAALCQYICLVWYVGACWQHRPHLCQQSLSQRQAGKH